MSLFKDHFRTLIIFAIFFIGTVTGRTQQYYFPPLNNPDWEKTSPESLGWCTDKIDSLYNFLETKNTRAFMVLKDGKIVLEKYFGSFTADSMWYWASAGKTLTGLLTGIAQKEGYLSIDLPVSTYLGQGWTSCSPGKEILIKVRNQITMTTGLNDDVSDPDCTSPECLQYLADAGNRWAYHNAPYTILDQVISNATGIDFNTYFATRIRNKTGMNGFWIYVSSNHIYFSTVRSMARFGMLMLAKGSWGGQPVLNDTSYFNSMTNTSQSLNPSYGFLTWLNGKNSYMLPQSQFVFTGSLFPDAPGSMYAAMGKNGQLINVVPDQGLVVLRMGDAPDTQSEMPNTFNNEIWKHLNNVICNSHGIKESGNSDNFTFYPNPASTEINIVPTHQSLEYKVSLFDLQGKLMMIGDNIRNLNISDIKPGMYVLMLVQDGICTRNIITIVH